MTLLLELLVTAGIASCFYHWGRHVGYDRGYAKGWNHAVLEEGLVKKHDVARVR